MALSNGFHQNRCCVAQARSGTGDGHNRHRQSSHCVGCSEAWGRQACDSMIRRGWKCEDLVWNGAAKGISLKRKKLSIALYRARQSMRRKQTDLNFKKAVEAGAPSRLQGPPPPTRAPILEKMGLDGTAERVEDLQGRTDIVRETPEWIWQRWPHEVLQSLPTVRG